METCSYHDIAYTSDDCPACDIQKELDDTKEELKEVYQDKDSLEIELENANALIQELSEQQEHTEPQNS